MAVVPSFFSALSESCRRKNSLLCVGLDPHVNDLKERTAKGALEFCKALVLATSSSAAAYKPNAAFFEAFGAEGWEALEELLRFIPDDTPVVLDSKRGDIGSTCEAYARSSFEHLDAGSVTVNAYLGSDSLTPFLSREGKAVWVLCNTSNAGAEEIQSAVLSSGQPVWSLLAEVGLVVGATKVSTLRAIREKYPSVWILAPGLGAQGGDMESAVQAGLDSSTKQGILFPVSRAISRADDPGQAAQDLVMELRAAANKVSRFKP